MKNLMTKLIVAVALIMIVAGQGCDDASGVVRFIQGLEIELFDNGGASNQLDAWSIGTEEIYGAAFGYSCRLESDGIPLTGIRIECHVLNHFDPVGFGWDIWDEFAPNGERYGYLRSVPAGNWDEDEQIATAYTDASGECLFIFGLGDPDTGFEIGNTGYLWPDGSDGVSTLVEVRFIIRKAYGDIVTDCFMVFFRAQYQNFWEPDGGVFGNSFSALTAWGGHLYGMDKSGGDIKMDSEMTGELELGEVALGRKFLYTGESSDKSGTPGLILNDPNVSGCEYLGGVWIKWYLGYGWGYVDGLIATWISNFDSPTDPNGVIPDPNILNPAAIMLAMDLSQPCAFLCAFDTDIDANDLENALALTHTGVVIAVDSEGQKVSQLPIKLYVYDVSGTVVCLTTDFILPMEFPEQQGEYYDSWGNSYAAIYVPEGGHLEVVKDSFFGDFDFDGDVDNEDYGLFKARWNRIAFEPPDPNKADYDLMYDADYDGRTGVSDLKMFMDNWLEIR